MSKAILIVGHAHPNGGVPMILGVPSETGHRWYFRNRTGERGRGNAWQPLAGHIEWLNHYITHKVEFPVTERDIQFAAAGKITDINIKAMRALDNEPPITGVHRLMVTEYEYHLLKDAESFPDSQEETVKAPIFDAEPAMLLASPDKAWADAYINRKVHGEVTDFDILDTAMGAHQNVLISGPAGSGKTICAMAYAASRGLNYYNISSHSGVEHSQLLGRWVPTEDGSFRFQYGPVAEIVRNGGVLLINEVNFLPAAVKTVLFSLLDHRREIQILDNKGEIIKAHQNLLIIADMNPGYRGTKPLNEAEKDRYAHKLEFPYDAAIEGKLVKSKALLGMAAKLREAFDREELITPVSTRALVAFQDNAHALGLDYAVYSFVNGFEDNERNAVRMAVETHKANIAADFGFDTGITLQKDEVR